MNNKYIAYILGLFILLGVLYVFADALPTPQAQAATGYILNAGFGNNFTGLGVAVGANSTQNGTLQYAFSGGRTNYLNLSGTINVTINFTSFATNATYNTNATNASLYYSTDNTTWTRIGSAFNSSLPGAGFGFNISWATADIPEAANLSILFVATNISGVGNSYLFGASHGTLAGIGGGTNNTVYNISYGVDIDNRAPVILDVNITDGTTTILNSTTAGLGGLSNGTRYLQNNTDLIIGLMYIM